MKKSSESNIFNTTKPLHNDVVCPFFFYHDEILLYRTCNIIWHEKSISEKLDYYNEMYSIWERSDCLTAYDVTLSI